MKAVLQRVSKAGITINGIKSSDMGKGLVVLLGISEDDTKKQAEYLADKIMGLRIFPDSDDKLNLSLVDIDGEILIVSNFTLCADCKKGKRPSFIKAAKPPLADGLYDYFVDKIKREYSVGLHTGEFGADMQIELINDGPVTITMDTTELMPNKQ